jgi:ubiquinone/menaquinone biosynthesis C-methylase UbiE
VRILDLGCGSGRELLSWGASDQDTVVGIDRSRDRLTVAQSRFSNRIFIRGSGERLPFKNATFDRVISSVALPYMDITRALAEINRVLVPGGSLSLSLHLPRFTISELLYRAVPHPIPTLFRLYVAANGLWFHCTGKTFSLYPGRAESFQTERGMRIALRRAGFTNPSFRRDTSWTPDNHPTEQQRSVPRGEIVLLFCSANKHS